MSMITSSLQEIDILGSRLHLCSKDQLLAVARQILEQSKRSYHFMALNPIKVIRSQSETKLRQYIDRADVVYADAAGICLATRILHKVTQQRIPGYELHFDILSLCEREERSVYILGAEEHVLQLALKKYQKIYPKLKITGSHHGYFSEPEFEQKILPEIGKLQPHLVLVAMGALVQEKRIARISAVTKTPLLLGIGGSLDAFVGEAPRAPKVMLDLGLEWLYRLARQPSRWRVMTALPIFSYRLVLSFLRN